MMTDYFEELKEIFPNTNPDIIANIVDLVESEISDYDEVQKLERMVTLLSDVDDKPNMVLPKVKLVISQDKPGTSNLYDDDYIDDVDDGSDNYQDTQSYSSNEVDNITFCEDVHPDIFEADEIAGTSDEYSEVEAKAEHIDTQHLKDQILKIFPKISKKFLKDLGGLNGLTLEEVIHNFETDGYPTVSLSKHEILKILEIITDASKDQLQSSVNNALSVFEIIQIHLNDYNYKEENASLPNSPIVDVHRELMDMLPTYCPDFLLKKVINLENEGDFTTLLHNLLEMKDYPTIDEYYENLKSRQKYLRHLFDFKIDAFLNAYPDLIAEFQKSRQHSLAASDNEEELIKDRGFAGVFICYVYKDVSEAEVIKVFKSCQYDIIMTCQKLGIIKKHIKIEKHWLLPDNSYSNALMFQELVYGLYQHFLNNYKRIQDRARTLAFQDAKEKNLLQTCMVCYNDELVFALGDCYQCTEGCIFCKICVQQGCGIAYSEGNTEIKCFLECDGYFRDKTLKVVMDDTAFVKLMRKQQMTEVANANVEGLELCPFCNFPGVLLRDDDRIFKCRECGKESCRDCKHISHVPLRCNEIEYDEDVKLRTTIENRMTDALTRICAKCGKRLLKAEGCNLLTCTCTATMCYVCGLQGITHAHFQEERCSQYANQQEFDRSRVLSAIDTAKVELGIDQDPTKLKFDPSKDF